MGITLADVQRWEPEQIDEVSEAAAQRARTSGQAAETLRNLSVFGTWKGDAGEAAQQAINQSATKLSLSQKEAMLVSLGAGKSAADVRTVKNDLQSLLDYAAAAPAVQIDLATNSVIPPDTTGWPQEDIDALAAKTAEVENKMVAVLAAAEEADADLARVLTAATGGDPELPAEQGTADGQSLQDGQLTPEEMARLEENTTLTPEQQEALVRGDLVLPASQMEYLNNLSRSLDGKSPAEIRAMIDQLNQNGQDGGAVTDALQLLGNEHVATAGADPEGRCPRMAACRTCRRVSAKRLSVRRAGPSCRHRAPTSKAIRRSRCPTRGIRSPNSTTTATSRRSCRRAIPRCSRARRWTRRCWTSRSRSCTTCTTRRALRGKNRSTCRSDSSTRRCRTCCPPQDATRWPCTAR